MREGGETLHLFIERDSPCLCGERERERERKREKQKQKQGLRREREGAPVYIG